ncbi:MAG: queuine tRNA-ribosyltransferase family protein, partial [Euryarchaeota archaeon]|nr:queuine tRNA-ribosyltransferase family protein [Euryarchaeota archaeon]
LHTQDGKINILNAKYREDFSKIDEDCDCYVCQNYTKVPPNISFDLNK